VVIGTLMVSAVFVKLRGFAVRRAERFDSLRRIGETATIELVVTHEMEAPWIVMSLSILKERALPH
jgi:hypothetical protein